ncbi:L-fucose kinase-like [Babylonia areolata]|uniref:L-fucose kinase-like n=1 Tax=Babylonia areolata TaxID=304850 RepID=UPI003FD3A47A
MGKMKWTAVVLTCSNHNWTHTLQTELEARQAKGQIDKDVILLTVDDPKTTVGSGGATINALLTVVEHISARRGFTVINPDVLEGANILILHHGTTYSYDACGRPFTTLPAKFSSSDADGLVCNLDILFKLITEKISVGAPPGVWVSSLDMLLAIPAGTDLQLRACDACLLTMPAKIQYAKDHGVCKVDTQGMVEDILYQRGEEVLEVCQRQDGTVPVVCGIVYLSTAVSGKVLTFYTKPPLDACTYFGLDSGQPPLKLSLFFDVLLPMTTAVSEADFVQGERSSFYGKPGTGAGDSKDSMTIARRLLWKELHGYRLAALTVEGGEVHYLTNLASEHKKMLLRSPVAMERDGLTWKNVTQADIGSEVQMEEDTTVINSVLKGEIIVGTKTVVSHSLLTGSIMVGKDSIVSGVNLDYIRKRVQFADSMVLQAFNICLRTLGTTRNVLTVHGRFDNIKAPTWKTNVTFCNEPWLVFLNRTGICNEDLWGTEVVPTDQTVLNAKLFPVFHATDNVGLKEILWLQGQLTDDPSRDMLTRWRSSWRLSLAEILAIVDLQAELSWRKSLFYKVAETEVEQALTKSLNRGFNDLYRSAAVDGFSQQILTMLDRVASQTTDPGMAARTLANIADVMGCMAGPVGGLRSGPAANQSWRKAFNFLENKDFAKGVAALAKERALWLDRPDHLIRAARHYEGAAQILIRHAVMTAKQFFNLGQGQLPPLGKWVQADCPARIDISGGWSDTPPITYEHGGAVTMVGVLINGKRPIGCKVRRIQEPVIRLELVGNGEVSSVVVCRELTDMEDYCQPHAPGSLLKAAFVCCDMVNVTSPTPLAQQLTTAFGGGFEMQSWSNLPHGSGMGTSSILSGAVLAALLTAGGKSYDIKGLIHAVLYLEQLLTTGGGWQDQIGGLKGGIHLGLSEAKLPLYVEPVDLQIPAHNIQEFNNRLLLIYTGKTRLARNLLQDVVRNWYARNPHIVSTEDALVLLAQDCSHAFIDGDFDKVGHCVARYWEMKKRMAPGCESQTIAQIMQALRPYMLGMCSSGAGGGGFIYGILRHGNMRAEAIEVLSKQTGLEEARVYEATIDTKGLTVSIES